MKIKSNYYIIMIILVIALIAILILTKPSPKHETELKTIQLNEVTRSVFYAPQYVAISNGFFEEQGLELEITTGQGADKVMTAILAGQSDIGLCGPEAAIYVYNEGKEDYIEVFAQLTQKDGSFLVSKENTNNFSWNDLKGKTVIPGRKGGVPYMTLEYVLKQNGINPSTDLTLDDSIKFDLMAGAFTGGDAEYVTLFEPTASITYCAKKGYIGNNQEIIEKFTMATYKGEQWVKEHTAREVAEKIQDFFPDTTLESLETSVQKYKDIEAWKENPILKKEAFDKLQLIMTEAGELEKKAPYEKVVNNSFAEKVTNNK